MAEIYTTSGSIAPAEWEWCIGGDWRSMTFSVQHGPHWLGRMLQRIFLDIHWRKIDA